MRAIIDLTGEKHGRLTVQSFAGSNKHQNATWKCVCECGKETIAVGYELRKGHTKSCGCLSKELLEKRNLKHGQCKIPEYTTWLAVKQRCFDPKYKLFKYYGGRGITICERWLNSFENFFADMGERPSSKHSIDRIDVNGNYTLENCKWSTSIEQARNRTDNKFIEYKGEIKTLAEWAEEQNINDRTLCSRLRRGWSVEKSMETPIKQQNLKQTLNK